MSHHLTPDAIPDTVLDDVTHHGRVTNGAEWATRSCAALDVLSAETGFDGDEVLRGGNNALCVAGTIDTGTGRRVAAVAKIPADAGDVDTQIRATRRVAGTGTGPEVLAVASTGFVTARILPGRCWGDTWGIEAHTSLEPVRQVLRQLWDHSPIAAGSTDVTRFQHGRLLTAQDRARQRGDRFAERLTAAALRIMDRLEAGPVVGLHGNPHPRNILTTPGGVALVDAANEHGPMDWDAARYAMHAGWPDPVAAAEHLTGSARQQDWCAVIYADLCQSEHVKSCAVGDYVEQFTALAAELCGVPYR